MKTIAIVLVKQHVVFSEYHDDRNLNFKGGNQMKGRKFVNKTPINSRSLASFNKTSSAVCSNLVPVRGVSMQSL